MKFKVENGTNHISIELGDRVDYFRFDNPLAVTWPYSGGTVGTYFCALPYSLEHREQLRSKLTNNLDRDFTGKVEELYDLLSPLFSLFKNGDYTLSYYNSKDKEFFRYKTSQDGFADWQYMPIQIAFGNEVDINQIETVKRHYADFVKENEVTKKYAPSNIFDFTTNWIYDGSDEFYATQPFNLIDEERVSHFEMHITEGARPLAIVMNAIKPGTKLQSPYFVVDGHHKLLAYQKLNIYPALAVINHYPDSLSIEDFDFEKLSTMLYPWQIRQILDDWDKRDVYLAEKLKKPDSPLHQFIRNGLINEYYENKKLKHQAFHINDKIEGKSAEWYENGQIKYERFFSGGRNTGVWKYYYPSGNIHVLQRYGETGFIDGEQIRYYENGQKQSSQSFRNGKYIDGNTSMSWFEDGNKEGEVCYLDGRIIERKNWNKQGQLVNHDVYDEEQKRLIKKTITIHSSYQNKQNESSASLKKNLNVIRERQYPETSYKSIWRLVAILSLVLLLLARMCH